MIEGDIFLEMTKRKRLLIPVTVWIFGLLISTCLIVIGILTAVGFWNNLNYTGYLLIVIGILLIILGTIFNLVVTYRFIKKLGLSLTNYNFKTGIGKLVKGPKIVVVGGGTGLGTILRGLKEISSNLTAVVTVADDGGSSGRLRRDFGILPPGDIRSCLVAMADLEPLMEQLMQYRFEGNSDLAGHNFGNLFLTVMTDITGDFVTALRESSKVLAVRGRVLPATLENVVLKAELANGQIVSGESNIPHSSSRIRRVFLEPENCKTLPAVMKAIREAEIVILGPGSLYTSVIPNLMVNELAETLRATKALKIYICNAMTQPGETNHYSASDHLKAIIEHAGEGLVDLMLVNTAKISAKSLEIYAMEGSTPVMADFEKIKALGATPYGEKLISDTEIIRHDPKKLTKIIEELNRQRELDSFFGKIFTGNFWQRFKNLSGAIAAKWLKH